MSPTFQRILLHLYFIELVGYDDDAVGGQMDAAARLRGFDLLQNKYGPILVPYNSLQILLILEDYISPHLSL